MSPIQQWASAPKFTLDLKKTYTATFVTDLGEIVVHLHADKVPMTVNNFVFLARKAFTITPSSTA